MTPLALALLVLSALAWSGLDAARKALGATIPAISLVVALGLGQALLIGAYVAATGAPTLQPAFWSAATASILINVIGNMLFIRAVTVSPFSLTVPLLALVPVLTTGVSYVMLGEAPSARQLVGIATVVAGAIALQLPPGGGLRDLAAALRAEPGAPMMLGVAACWAVVGPFDKTATLASSPAFHGMAVNLGMGLVLLPSMLRVGRAGVAPLAARPMLLTAACMVGAAAILLQFEVMRTVLVSQVEAIKRVLGLVVAVLAGRFAFGEGITGRKAAAIATMGVGTAILLL